MVIEWLGHSCFLVTTKNGTRILYDPYDDTVGYSRPEKEADIVVVSHDHFDHNNLERITGSYTLVNTPGVHTFGEITIECIKTFHDHSNGAHRGENLVSVLSVRGIRLCHMGDIGCIPADDVIEKLKGAHILLIPVGGHFTIDAKEALTICERIEPNIIIPMHFSTPLTDMEIAPLHEFLEAAGREYDVSHPGQCYLQIDMDSLKKRTRIVVMEYL
jgi:L-ascorbate metabolism protein UlaG (beta-lactamase superfamily)